RDPSAAGRADTLGAIPIGSAPEDTVTAIVVCPRRAVRWCSIVLAIAILDPLRDTTVHIVEPKRIRCEFSATIGGQLVLSAALTVSLAPCQPRPPMNTASALPPGRRTPIPPRSIADRACPSGWRSRPHIAWLGPRTCRLPGSVLK